MSHWDSVISFHPAHELQNVGPSLPARQRNFTQCPPVVRQPVLLQQSFPQVKATHLPARHPGVDPLQTLPHVPQLSRSEVLSTHCVPHRLSGGVHSAWQVPPEHTSPVAHVFPQVPQFAWSVCVLAQYGAPASPPGQSVSPAPHESEHAPPLQTFPVGQTFPQVPQFALSVAVVAHDTPASLTQTVCADDGHWATHVPAVHIWPALQPVPQLPQLFGSTFTSTHDAPHCVVPAEHVSEHAPAEQT